MVVGQWNCLPLEGVGLACGILPLHEFTAGSKIIKSSEGVCPVERDPAWRDMQVAESEPEFDRCGMVLWQK